MRSYKIGIIGCGLIGHKRATALPKNCKVEICCDNSSSNLNKFAKQFSCAKMTRNWEDVTKEKNIDIIIVAVFHNVLFKVTRSAIENGKHVLCEKPGAISEKEINQLIKISNKHRKQVHIGYNHRFLSSIEKAIKIAKKNKNIGKLTHIRAVYGHGGRPGYDKEWRAVKEISGGGELLDQGSHIIDLAYLFIKKDLKIIGKSLNNFFWKIKVEDNAFLILTNKDRNVVNVHVSWSEWKNKFSFEIFFKKAKIEISGKGGSYGKEILTLYRMNKKMGPPKTKHWYFKDIDLTWKKEWAYFIKNIESKKFTDIELKKAKRVMKIVESAYK